MPNVPKLSPENLFPEQAISQSVQVQPDVSLSPWQGSSIILAFASAADMITPWGRNTQRRDRELRDFWPTEPYLAGAVATVSFRNAAFDWEIKSKSIALAQSVTEMLNRAISGDKIGWTDFIKKFSQDLYTTDNGAFIELIREEGVDANSKFKGAMAPVIGIANLDSNQCVRTGNAEIPVLYEDRNTQTHKLKWWQVISFSDFPSAIERMNGVGYSSVTRSLRLAQIMKSMEIFKDEKIGGRNAKEINVVSGVSRADIEDAVKRTKEGANNAGNVRYIDNVVLASLDPEKPVSVATIALASLPDGFDLDTEMQWFIAGLALNFGVDYQEFAPLPGGNIGSSAQSQVLARKSSGKGPRNWMDSLTEAFKNYGVLPRGCEMVFNDQNVEEELEKQTVRTKAMEEAAIAANARIFPRKKIAEDLVSRGLYKSLDDIPEDFWVDTQPAPKQPVGDRGGNTILEDSKRQDTGKPNPGLLGKLFGRG
jgi:hypothetical protein